MPKPRLFLLKPANLIPKCKLTTAGGDRGGCKTVLKGNETISWNAEIILENAGII